MLLFTLIHDTFGINLCFIAQFRSGGIERGKTQGHLVGAHNAISRWVGAQLWK